MHPQPKSTPKVDPRVDHKAKPKVEQVGSSPSAIMENTILFFCCPVAGAALPNFISQPQPYLVFFLLTDQRSNSGIITGQDGQAGVAPDSDPDQGRGSQSDCRDPEHFAGLPGCGRSVKVPNDCQGLDPRIRYRCEERSANM